MKNTEIFMWIWGVIGVGLVGLRIVEAIVNRHSKIINIPGWVWIGVFAAFFVHVYFLTKPVNAPRNIDKYISEYIDNSIEIGIYNIDNKDIKDAVFDELYTGLNLNKLNRSKLSSVPNNYFDFYSSDYNKYFRVLFVSSAESMTIYESNMKNKLVKVKVNQSQLNDPNYGTRENPIPVLYLDIPKYKKSPHYWIIEKTPEEYRESVYYYLAYIMPKDEFKRRFSSVNHN